MNQDGVRQGYDIEQLAKVRAVCECAAYRLRRRRYMAHFLEVFAKAKVDAALAASVFHKGIIEIQALKAFLKQSGVAIRS